MLSARLRTLPLLVLGCVASLTLLGCDSRSELARSASSLKAGTTPSSVRTATPQGARVAPRPTPGSVSVDATDSVDAATHSTDEQGAADPMPRDSKQDSAEPFITPSRAFPAELRPGEPSEVKVAGDRALRVTQASGENVHPIIYLHGMCGNSKGADPWGDIASRYGTLIVVRADVPCGDRPGFKWPKEVSVIQARIDQALDLVKQMRGGWLDTAHPTLIGYSQGAYRAEQLAQEYPERYVRAILGGPPTPPSFEALRTLKAVAVLGGELEDHAHMLAGTEDLIAHGAPARFFLLPGVHHGSYGPQGRRVLSDALKFVFEEH